MSYLFISHIKMAEDFVSLPLAAVASQLPQLDAERQTTSLLCPCNL